MPNEIITHQGIKYLSYPTATSPFLHFIEIILGNQTFPYFNNISSSARQAPLKIFLSVFAY